jgi:hypothetical protein
MKANTILSFLFAALLISPAAMAQIQTPRPSPGAELEQTIGITEVELEYSRPGVKGRTIYGDLVPFDEKWRTGANSVTIISFSTDAKINGSDIEEGEYALLTTPGEEEWIFHFYPLEGGSWSSYKDKEAALEVTAKSNEMPIHIESMMFVFDNVKDASADLGLAWEGTVVWLSIEVPTAELVEANIEEVMAGPSENEYYSAAQYYLGANKNLDMALEYIQHVTSSDDPSMWAVRLEAEIQAARGDYKAAIAAAERSSAIAAASDSQWKDYITGLNDEDIAEWKKKK